MTEKPIRVPGCKRTTVSVLFTDRRTQILKVHVARGGEIPLHQHKAAATMIILRGKARVLGKERRAVRPGSVVAKKSMEPHGFSDVRSALTFLSFASRGSIVKESRWDLQYVP